MAPMKNSIKRDTSEIWNVPNVLTMLRMALIAVFAVLFAKHQYVWAMVVFLLAAATDLLDGYIARKTDKITNFGKLMDPLADKLMLIVALICMVARGYLPLGILLFVLLKEGVMVVGGLLLYNKDVVVYAAGFGKVATFVFNAAVVISILGRAFPALSFIAAGHIDIVVFGIAILLAICAVVQYVRHFWKQLRDKKQSRTRNLK